jgi:DNA-binding LytR/AlgR family response regulator
MTPLKILIIEDEEPAANRLWKMVKEILPDAMPCPQQHSVQHTIRWLRENPMPDLIISDIQLSDGISFEIFKAIPNTCPVIFTTAFDQYAIQAFKINSIDYILKPVKKPELQAALSKFMENHQKKQAASLHIDEILKAFQAPAAKEYKKRFAVRYGDHIKTINTSEVAYFNTEEKINFLTTFDNRRYITDINLEALETMLDPAVFFRINRQFIISIQAISEMLAYSKGRVLIRLNPPCKQETIVSAERSPQFKHWLDDNTSA